MVEVFAERLQAVSGAIHRDVPVVDFVELVYNFRHDQIPTQGDAYFLPDKSCRQFFKAKNITESYGPLRDIFNSVQTQLRAHWGDVKLPLSLELHVLQPEDAVRSSVPFVPCFYLSTQVKKPWKAHQMRACLGCGGYERSPSMHRWAEYDGWEIDLGVLKKESARSKYPRPKRKTLLFQGRKKPQTRGSLRKLSSSELASPVRTTKRKRALSLDAIEESDKRQRMMKSSTSTSSSICEGTDLRQSDHAAIQFLTNLMTIGVRSYGTGWMLENTTMRLWYADRMGVVVSDSFDIFEEAHYLVFLLAAITSAGAKDLGICHLLKTPSNVFDQYKNLTLEIDKAETNTGTLSDLKFKVLTVDTSDRDIICRGTMILHVRAIGIIPPGFGGNLVAKVVWVPDFWIPEHVTVRAVLNGLRKAGKSSLMKHIVDIKCALHQTMQEVGLPRAFMTDKDLDEDRIRSLRCYVMRRYHELHLIDSAEELKSVWVGVIRAHHWTYETTGIIHRDISPGNIMFYREHGQAIGVLCDWEFAEHSRGDCGGQFYPSRSMESSQRRAGTREFMAIDLNDGSALVDPSPHLYRFDLESFFWILIFICTWHQPKQHNWGDWADNNETPEDQIVFADKLAFLEKDEHFEAAFEKTDPEYRPLVSTWIKGLRQYFKCMVQDWDDIKKACDKVRTASYRGSFREEAVASERLIRTLEERRADSITYEGFMQCIGIDTKDQ